MASLTAIEFHWSEARPRSSAAVLKNEPEMRKVLTIAVFQISSAHWLCSTRTSSGRRSVCWSGSRQQAWAGQMTRVALGRHLVWTRASESTGSGCEITTKWCVPSKNLTWRKMFALQGDLKRILTSDLLIISDPVFYLVKEEIDPLFNTQNVIHSWIGQGSRGKAVGQPRKCCPQIVPQGLP